MYIYFHAFVEEEIHIYIQNFLILDIFVAYFCVFFFTILDKVLVR